uniref:Uncharacterized protein LOC116946344 isoform X2 n=1 Tax=Petromyzon marinus TaxID=7757 RepID=A0AAJ7TG80_PETMA|nr:uncharacterized protein LOC116946344 isoform X2 [Petromyzon marinus]
MTPCDVIEEGGTQAACSEDGLARFRDEFKVVGDVRGKGLMIGVELVTDMVRLQTRTCRRMQTQGAWARLIHAPCSSAAMLCACSGQQDATSGGADERDLGGLEWKGWHLRTGVPHQAAHVHCHCRCDAQGPEQPMQAPSRLDPVVPPHSSPRRTATRRNYTSLLHNTTTATIWPHHVVKPPNCTTQPHNTTTTVT